MMTYFLLFCLLLSHTEAKSIPHPPPAPSPHHFPLDLWPKDSLLPRRPCPPLSPDHFWLVHTWPKDGKKNSTTEKATASTGSQGKDKAVDSKHYKLLDYYGTMTTLSILYFHAFPEKSLYDERFTRIQGKPPRKQETRIRIQNLLVVAVLVAGVTFAGAIQMPQQNDKNNSTALNSSTVQVLLDGYLCLDVWALNSSVVAAIILLWTHLNDVKFAPFAVRFSSLMVGGSIYMMCLSFFFAVTIALWGGSTYGLFATILIVMGIVFFLAQTLLYILWILQPSVNQIIEGNLSHYVYYISFMFVYNWRCLTDSLHKLRDLWTKPK